MSEKPTMAAGLRWLVGHLGQRIETVQIRTSTGTAWEPGPRTLSKKGSRFALDGSYISLTRHHKITAIDDTSLTVAWYYDEAPDETIHITTYREAKED